MSNAQEEFESLYDDILEDASNTSLSDIAELPVQLENVDQNLDEIEELDASTRFLDYDPNSAPATTTTDEDVDDDGSDDGEGSTTQQVDIVASILAMKGINDPSKIKYEDDEGNVVEYDFNDLDEEEQRSLLSFEQDLPYTDEELQTLEYLKENNLTLEELVDEVQRLAVEDYIRNSALTGFGIDTISDEELFRLDLQSSYEDLTEEEVNLQLQKELEHKEFFDKKMKKLRQEYLEAENAMKETSEREAIEAEEEKYNLLADELVDVAKGIDDIGGLDLNEDDKMEVLSFILDRDSNGVSNFIKILEDPNKLFELAWYAVKGTEAFDTVHSYYKKQIELSRKENKTQTGTTRKRTAVVVPKTTTPKNTTTNDVTTIDDLYTF